MPLTLIVTDNYDVRIDTNDRGEWDQSPATANDSAVSPTFVGFGGENTLSVFLMAMGGGVSDVLIVYTRCGYPAQFLQSRCGYDEETATVNRLLAHLLTYPESL